MADAFYSPVDSNSESKIIAGADLYKNSEAGGRGRQVRPRRRRSKRRSKSSAASRRASRSLSRMSKSVARNSFSRQLRSIGYSPASYLTSARKAARKTGYDPSKLNFANDNNHNLVYESPEGRKYFGKVGYGDFLIWSFKERHGSVERGYANMKRHVFRTSHGEITRLHHLNKFSPNELSINILW